MEDLVTWLRAQLDEDERVANEAIDQGGRGRRGEASWIVTNPETLPGAIGDQLGNVVTFNGKATTGWSPSRFQAEHIARHDPARVLREVEAKRALLDYLVDLEHKALDGNWWNLDTNLPLRLLALPFADRPGYQESWKP